jgi:hypothetical protein
MKLTNEGKVFYLDEETWIKLRVVSPELLRKYEDKDPDAEFWDYVIVDWNNVEDENGPIHCTSEHKDHLMKTSPMFVGFVNKFLTELNEEYRKILEKN